MSTNYFNTFIEVAEDCPTEEAMVPPTAGDKRTVAALQYDLIEGHPYEYTSDDVIFEVYCLRQGITEPEKPAARDAFFARDQPCLRTSPLGKRYGWGVHHNDSGHVALFAVESDEYQALTRDDSLRHLKAMRSRRA